MIANQDTYISITRTFDAPLDAVFAAWTTPTQIRPLVRHRIDQGGGRIHGREGRWRLEGRMILPDGNEIGWHGSYQEVEAPSRLVMTLSDRPGDQFELVTVELRSVGGGTEMTFTQSGGNMPPENYAQAEDGWRSFFDALATGLAD